MPDFDAITIALAARFAPAQVTPPTGYDNIRVASGNLPGQMTPLPTVLVFPSEGEFDYTLGIGKRDSAHNFTVRFYYNQIGDMERDTIALRKWLTVLVDQLRLSSMLGGIVTSAKVIGYSVDALPYAGLTYSGIELTVRVVTNEPWAAVA